MGAENGAAKLFSSTAEQYEEKPFTHATVAEIDFLVAAFALPAGSAILDMGCGTGRHAIEFARRGYRVTGVDIAHGMLDHARRASRTAGVTVEWIEADATHFTASHWYDAAVCLYGGAFGILNPGDDPATHDLAVLRAIGAALQPAAPLVLTTLNAFARLREVTREDVDRGRFNLLTLEETYTDEAETVDGKEPIRLKERRWLPPELVALFIQAGFTVEHIGGGASGDWSRRSLRLDEPEVMVMARRMGGRQ